MFVHRNTSRRRCRRRSTTSGLQAGTETPLCPSRTSCHSYRKWKHWLDVTQSSCIARKSFFFTYPKTLYKHLAKPFFFKNDRSVLSCWVHWPDIHVSFATTRTLNFKEILKHSVLFLHEAVADPELSLTGDVDFVNEVHWTIISYTKKSLRATHGVQLTFSFQWRVFNKPDNS